LYYYFPLFLRLRLFVSSLAIMSSLWNAFQSGNKPNQQKQQQQQQQPQPMTTADTFDPSAGQGVEAFLQSSTFADPSALHPLAGLNKDTLEYLTLEDSALSDMPGGQSIIPSRGFTDDLCYGTGVTYLTGLSIGGAWGLTEGLRRSAGQPPKLRLNSVLNAVTRRGPFLGNSGGAIAIVYNIFNWSIGSFRGKHDAANTIAAGALSGVLFKCTRGVRQMAISGGLVASIAGGWAVRRPHPFIRDSSICHDVLVLIISTGSEPLAVSSGCQPSSAPRAHVNETESEGLETTTLDPDSAYKQVEIPRMSP
jgi:import inner membrane translocase subunit TIM23